MRCPICGDETAGEKTQQCGPEWAHVLCVKAYSLGGCDARQAQREAVAAADLMPELKAMYKAYVRLLETARDRLSDLGYQCDSLETMERKDPYLIACRKAIAAAPGGER